MQHRKNDTIEFKILVAYEFTGKYNPALEKFSEINKESVYYDKSLKEYCNSLLLSDIYDELQNTLAQNDVKYYQRLLYLSYLFTSVKLPDEQNFLNVFPSS